jgi:Fic family protein
MIRYEKPRNWVHYDAQAVIQALAEAKAAVLALKSMPYQRQWVEELQKIELKREIAGTSRIEGAEFTDKELDTALRGDTSALLTRSQRQAQAAKRAYEWLAGTPDDRAIDEEWILTLHRHIVTGADDDHCPPGRTRGAEDVVSFGTPRHLGAEGGAECAETLRGLAHALAREFRGHDPIVQAHAAHYHIAAMHPFLDGNGRTARALEVLLLGRAGLKDVAFIAISNYYYEEKPRYLAALAETRQRRHDLTPFLVFALKGVATQCERLLQQIRLELRKGVFRNTMHDLYGLLQTPRKRVIAQRQLEILKELLRQADWIEFIDLLRITSKHYADLKHPAKACINDLGELSVMGAIEERDSESSIEFRVNLDWPAKITEPEFRKKLKEMPKARTTSFLQS